MALAKDLVGIFTPAQAEYHNGNINASVSAAGTLQSDATTLGASVNVITTAAASTGVVLPTNMDIRDSMVVYNDGANAVKIYPMSGSSINQLSANSAFTLQTNTAALIYRVSSTQLVAFLSA